MCSACGAEKSSFMPMCDLRRKWNPKRMMMIEGN
jgi:hypothetical protein